MGDKRAPEVLAMMYRMGQRLYGDQVHVDTVEAARWAAIAAERSGVSATAPASLRH